MTAKDLILGPCLICGFGLWLLIFPESVIRFYTWFHQGTVKMPKAGAIRIVGATWLALAVIVAGIRVLP
jgi:hypothetical protein